VSDLTLTFACGPYDRMEPLRTGEIAPEGIRLDYIPVQAPREIFDRMVGKREFAMSELSLSEFVAQTANGDCPFVALPVFPSKAFRHGFICINTKAGIEKPADLSGKRIGVPLYTMTAAIWLRGILQHEYGVNLDSVTWVQGAVEKAGSHGTPHALPLLKPANIEVNDSDKSLGAMLADGGIDALIGSRLPDTLGVHPDVARLFPDFRAAEIDYYRRTGIHPIMHLVAIRRDVYEASPWIAAPLYKAFCAAKDKALQDLRFSGAQRAMLPFLYADIAEIDEIFAGDPWPYGIEANRATLETCIRYMVEQHFIAAPMPVEALFLPVGEP
jgi:4,5-dihydroxyphthalate decarboxylase